MHKVGTVIRWDTTRAFGFIRSPDTSADVFFHVRDFRGSTAPHEGLEVRFEEIHVGGKGPRAMAVQPAVAAKLGTASARTAPSRAPSPAPQNGRTAARQAPQRHTTATRKSRTRRDGGTSNSAVPVLLLTAGWAGLIGWGIWTRQWPLGWTLAAAVLVNLVTFWAYAADKSAAIQGRWRTQESHLHLLSLAGGWPGAWWAQQTLRHKSSKQAFRLVYWLTVLLHCAALATWLAIHNQ